MTFTRRDFLQTATASLGVALVDRTPADLEKAFAEIRVNLLEMINEERAVEKVRPLEIDELATQVATKHAIEMARDEFASHWNRDGLKPYHRYSFAGGTHATQENISAADDTWSLKEDQLKQDTAYLHVRLYQEKPPYDGHRKTILAPQHTHVGIGTDSTGPSAYPFSCPGRGASCAMSTAGMRRGSTGRVAGVGSG